MFWKLFGSLLVCLFVSSESGLFVISKSTSTGLTLTQQKSILEWNLARNQQNRAPLSAQRLQTKIERIKKKNYRLFLEETTLLPKKELKLRLSQENLHEGKPNL